MRPSGSWRASHGDRGTAFLITSTNPRRIQENFDLSTLPNDALEEMRDGIKTNIRFNTVVGTGVPGFIPQVPHH
ncbi:MAG TPA: hypothetical protein VGJ21_15950 [Terracidiphilus sp.]|jgi:hypothetical protein